MELLEDSPDSARTIVIDMKSFEILREERSIRKRRSNIILCESEGRLRENDRRFRDGF
jgi:hypothetical protein